MTPEPADRRAALAAELAETARTLSESDLLKVHPADAHALLQDLHTAIGDGAGATIEDAAAQLLAASRFLSAARDAIAAADETNSETRWKRRRSTPTSHTDQ